MSTKTAFKDTALYDWDDEPLEVRPSAFFYDSDYVPPSPKQKPLLSTGTLLVAAFAVILAFGVTAFMTLGQFLKG
jgi:hypothetical protein